MKVDGPYGTLNSHFDDIRKLMFIKFCDIISHNLIIHNFKTVDCHSGIESIFNPKGHQLIYFGTVPFKRI